MALDTSKIIHAPVGGGRYTVTAPIIKEDYGLYLKIEGLDLPTSYEVDFSNDEHAGSSITMIGDADGVLIPSQFISTGKDIFAFLYHVGADFGRTIYKFRIPNKLRPDRTDEEPTPEEQSVIDQAISALNSAVTATAQDVIDADASAQSASQSSEQAQESARTAGLYSDTAQTYANSAEISANSASASATASAQSASQSAQIKADVEDMVDDAQASASASAQSATASANSASQASGYVQSASASAQSASGYASSAETSAHAASAKASEASASASTASQKASESAQSAINAQTYATQAESAKTASQTAQGLAESAKADAITAKDDAESARDEAQSIVDGISGKVEQIDSNTERIESLEDDRYKPYAVDTASGAVASFTDGADDIPLKSLVVDIDPIQDLSHGDPSPENICPISGWTEVDVEQSGVNVWDEEWEVGTIDGRAPKSTIHSKNFCKILPNTTYYATCGKTDGGNQNRYYLRVLFYDASKNFISYGYYNNLTFTTPENAAYFKIETNTSTVIYGNVYNHDISINYPSTDHSYHPYTGRSITIDLGQTVYGGHIDVLSGELVVDMAMVDLGTLNWTYEASRERFRGILSATSSASTSNPEARTHCLCSIYKTSTVAYNDANRTFMVVCVNTDYVWLRDNRFTDAATFKTAMSGVQLCYELAAPIEIQLSANQINSLYGVNNLWANSGDTEVVYRADTKLFIERLTAPDSADMIADANITSGKYFMVGNSLYKATANIANGSAIIVGTNAVRKSLSEALNEINA